MANFKKFELNIPEWVDFVYEKSYNWPEPSGTNPDRPYEGKTIKGGPYWSFSLRGDDLVWSVQKKELAEIINDFLAELNRHNRPLRLAVMKFPGQGTDKKHYHAISDGVNVRVFPLAGVPQRFAEFTNSAPPLPQTAGAAAASPPTLSAAASVFPPPPNDPIELMQTCLADAIGLWQYELRRAWDAASGDKEGFKTDMYATLKGACIERLGATAHSLFVERQKIR